MSVLEKHKIRPRCFWDGLFFINVNTVYFSIIATTGMVLAFPYLVYL